MTKHIRFSLNRNADPTTPDSSPLSCYGILEGDNVFQTEEPWDSEGTAEYSLADVRLLPPCWPTKIVCVGRNYADHAKELGNPVPAEPLIFMKPPSSLITQGDDIVAPSISQLVSFEGELGLVIGRSARNIAPGDWQRYVWGYTCVNDVTARDLQKKDGQWTRGKGFDTFCPVGPWIVPASEVDFASLRVLTSVNGEVKQDAPVSDMIFDPGAILAFVTRFMTLEAGDLIATGTPPGVGPIVSGDTVRIHIEGVATLENKVKNENLS